MSEVRRVLFRDFIPGNGCGCYSRRHANEGIVSNKVQVINGEKCVPGTVSAANCHLADAVIV